MTLLDLGLMPSAIKSLAYFSGAHFILLFRKHNMLYLHIVKAIYFTFEENSIENKILVHES